MMPRPALRLSRARQMLADPRGATILEFGLILPALCVLLLGAFDFGHSLYMKAILQGAIQKAARDGTLETGAETAVQTAIDNKVRAQLIHLQKHATVTFNRRYYRTFAEAATPLPETFTDTATGIYKDGLCNNGEAYMDMNNNGVWDQDGGNAGQGGARDKVVYTVTISYPRVMPLDKFIGGSGTTTLSAVTVLANQPYGDQASYGGPTVRFCS